MSHDARESSRSLGAPIQLYLFEGGGVETSDFSAGPFGPYAYTDAEEAVVRTHNDDPLVFEPVAVARGAISTSGTTDKTTLDVRLQDDVALADEFKVYPPSQPVNLTIFEGHIGEDPDTFQATWAGKMVSYKFVGIELQLVCEPITSALRRPILRRNWQYSCPHALYGDQCKASRPAATLTSTVESIGTARIGLPAGWNGPHAPAKYIGGMVGWTREGGVSELRAIRRLSDSDLTVHLAGPTPGLEVGDTVQVILGCNRLMGDCSTLHNNILNFGGQPWIPTQNPIGPANQFY